MKEGRVVEPDQFAGLRMSGCGRADLSGSQAVAVFPFKFNSGLTAIGFDHRPVLGLKDLFPSQPKPIAEVANVHPLLRDEALADGAVDALINPATVTDQRLASLLRRGHTTKAHFHRKNVRVRV